MFTCSSTHGSSDFLLDQLAHRLGLPAPQPGDRQHFLETLRQLPEEKFCLPYDKHLTCRFTSIDGEFFPKSIADLRKDPDYLHKVGFYARDYLVTLTNNEGQCLSQGPFLSPGIKEPDEKCQAKAACLPLSTYQTALEHYNQPSFESQWPKNDICIEPVINIPAFEFLETATTKAAGEGQDQRGKSYFLWFDHMPSYYPPSSSVEGTPHSIDLCYLFDITPDEILKTYYGCSTEKNFTEEDKRMKSDYIRLVTDFMKYGNPNCPAVKAQTGQDWPEYELDNEFYLNFASSSQIKQFPIKKRRSLWKEIIVKWRQEANDE